MSLLASGGLETFVEDIASEVATASPTPVNLLLEPVARSGQVWWVWVLEGLIVIGLIYLLIRAIRKH